MNTKNEQLGNEAKAIQATGSCHCGAVEYTVSGPILGQSYCNCQACQKATGALQVSFVSMHKDSVEIDKGDPVTVQGRTGVKCDEYGVWQRCPECGTKVFWVSNAEDQIDVLAGTLDDPSIFSPGS